MEITIHIAKANEKRVLKAFVNTYPQPEEGPQVQPTDWAKTCIERFVVGTVARYEQSVKQRAIKLEPDLEIIESKTPVVNEEDVDLDGRASF